MENEAGQALQHSHSREAGQALQHAHSRAAAEQEADMMQNAQPMQVGMSNSTGGNR